MAVAWVTPYRIGCLSVSHVLSMPAVSPQVCGNTGQNPLYADSSSFTYYGDTSFPFQRDHIRPSMLLAAANQTEARALIDRGLSAERTNASGTAYLMQTSDSIRSMRAIFYPARLLGTAISPKVNVVQRSGSSIANTTDALFYFQGLARVPATANQFPPGAIVDNLTSYGGKLTENSGQTSILDFISAGATASFGTVVEPYARRQKFPAPAVVVRQYSKGLSLVEAYWGSVEATAEGLFIGDPLANPWRH